MGACCDTVDGFSKRAVSRLAVQASVHGQWRSADKANVLMEYQTSQGSNK